MIEKRKNKMPIFYIKLAVVAVLVCAVLTGCDEFVSWQTDFSLKDGASWHMDIRCQATPYHLDDATIDFYLGFYDRNNPIKRDFEETKNNYWALYFCNGKAKLQDANNISTTNYKNIENHHFIRIFSDQEAFTSSQYQYVIEEKRIVYDEYEEITIPRTILKGYEGEIGIKLLSIKEEENGSYLIQEVGGGVIFFKYEIIDDEYVKIDLSNAFRGNH